MYIKILTFFILMGELSYAAIKISVNFQLYSLTGISSSYKKIRRK